jgi:transcriptional regulator with XRE-family HTH domain
MDTSLLARELVRRLRGRRGQVALSRQLGFSTNVLYAWESGRNQPRASQFLALAEQRRVPVRERLQSFYVRPPEWLDGVDAASPEAVAAFLRDQRGRLSIVELARASGLSRFALSRWFDGSAEPRLPDFLALVEACTRRLGEWVALFVDPAELPSLAESWRRQQAARRAAYGSPWTQAVLRALELSDYRALPRHEPGWIARRLDIPLRVEVEALDVLEEGGVIELRRGAYRASDAEAIDLRADPDAAAAQRAFWVGVAAERARRAKGMFAYNVCGVSEADLARLKALQRDFLQQARAIVAESTPVERVALLQVQVMSLDDFHPAPE